MSAPEQPTELAPHLFHPDDPVETFLNCYCLCRPRRNEIINLIHHEDRATGMILSEFTDMIRNHAPEIDFQRKLIRNNNDEVLLRAMSLMEALAAAIVGPTLRDRIGYQLSGYSEAYQSSPAFGAQKFWLSVSPGEDARYLLRHRVGKRPRDIVRLHDTFDRHHVPLTVTPAVLDDWKLVAARPHRGLENYIARRIDSGEFRIAVSSLSSSAEIVGASRSVTREPLAQFRLTEIKRLEDQVTALCQILSDAHAAGATFLVLPELRMPPALLQVAKNFLRTQEITEKRGLLLVVAGSWHIESNERLYNRCEVLNHYGEPLWAHDKLREYVIEPKDVSTAPELCRAIGVGQDGGREDIERGDTLQFYDSIVGRIAISICVGFFSPEVKPLLEASGADIFLVPAMTPSMLRLEDRANELVGSRNAFTAAANCGTVGKDAPSFWRRPAVRDYLQRMAPGDSLLLLDLNDISK